MRIKKAEKIAARIDKRIRQLGTDIESLGVSPQTDFSRKRFALLFAWKKHEKRLFPWK